MGGISTFVAEVPVDLEDALDTAHDCPLEEEFWCDPQIELNIERIHMGRERASRGTPVHRLQHRRLQLDEVPLVERLPQRAHDGGPQADHLPCGRPRNQVHMPTAHPVLLGGVLVQRGQRPQRLGRERPGVHEHGQLPASGGDHPTAGEQVVAQVDVGLEVRHRLLADLPLGDHVLQLVPGAVLHGDEAQLAGVAQVHHPAGDPDLVLGLLAGRQDVVVLPAHLGNGVRERHSHRIGLDPGRQHPLPLGQPHPYLFRCGHAVDGVLVSLGWGGGGVLGGLGHPSIVRSPGHISARWCASPLRQ